MASISFNSNKMEFCYHLLSVERKTLKIVAKYADACNLFGSAETIKRKLDVLKEHCKKHHKGILIVGILH